MWSRPTQLDLPPRWRGYATWRKGGVRWFGIPAGLGLACLAALQLERTIRRERRGGGADRPGPEDYAPSWQLTAFRLLPARLLSRCWGKVMDKELPLWLRGPLLGLYVRVFDCHMAEAVEEEVGRYRSFSALFTRQLKAGARPINRDHPLVCPADGKVLHLGEVDEDGCLEQIKGVSYKLHHFLGQQAVVTDRTSSHGSRSYLPPPDRDWVSASSEDDRGEGEVLEQEETCQVEGEGLGSVRGEEERTDRRGTKLYHVTIYLAPGDYHGFHSPTNWSALTCRHFPGELLTVAPWAVRTMPGLFTLNERVLLLGQWEHGFFSFAAVGAYNVGNISLTIDKKLITNQKGRYVMGQFSDKQLPCGGGRAREARQGIRLGKGQRLGTFQMGSSIVLVFEAPRGFEFCVGPGESVHYGQALGQITRN